MLSKSARIDGNQKIPRSSAPPRGGGGTEEEFKFQVRTVGAASLIHVYCQNHQSNAPRLLTEKQLLCVELEML